MPAPERPRADPRKPDLSAIPSFLRDVPRDSNATAGTTPGAASRPALAIPRPSTPAPASAPPRKEPALDPAALPMPSLSRRRLVTAAGVLLAGVLLLGFARQVGDASAASARATELRAANAALRDQVARLEADLGHVQDVRYIRLEGRAFGLGGPDEIPFALAAGAPGLAADAPGSASVRLGAIEQPTSPLEAWLEVLFGDRR